ncbi:MAG: SDR family oxidoreductase [Acidimicrobiales bacterium]
MDVRGEFALDGRVAVVTGAAGLLGREFAAALASVGARTVLVDRDEASAAAVADRIVADGGIEPTVLAIDISDEAEVDEAIGSLERVDALVNSAAIDPKVEPGRALAGRLATYDLAAWEASLRVNLTGTFLVTRACVRTMEGQGDRGRGAIVNVSSTYGLVGPDQRLYEEDGRQAFVKPVDYSVTKAGVLGFTRAVAAMYAGTEIRVNALSPGGARAAQDDGFVERYSSRAILGRMADPGDYRAAMVFLCSDASRYMTGANLVVDGGWTAW